MNGPWFSALRTWPFKRAKLFELFLGGGMACRSKSITVCSFWTSGVFLALLCLTSNSLAQESHSGLVEQAQKELQVPASKPAITTPAPSQVIVQARETLQLGGYSKAFELFFGREKIPLQGEVDLLEGATVKLKQMGEVTLNSLGLRMLYPTQKSILGLENWGWSSSVSYTGRHLSKVTLQDSKIQQARHHLFVYSANVHLTWKYKDLHLFTAQGPAYSHFLQVTSDSTSNRVRGHLHWQSIVGLGWSHWDLFALEVSSVNRKSFSNAKQPDKVLPSQSFRAGAKLRWTL
jgi:hypothetical protein